MSDTVWAAIIAVAGAVGGTLLGATLSHIFTLMNRREEAERLRDQYLLDIEVKKIQDVLLALHNATNMISTFNPESPTYEKDTLTEINNYGQSNIDLNNLLVVTLQYFKKEERDAINKARRAIREQFDLANELHEATQNNDEEKRDTILKTLAERQPNWSDAFSIAILIVGTNFNQAI